VILRNTQIVKRDHQIMGDTISTLVFRPPPPTLIKLNKFFYIKLPSDNEDTDDYEDTDEYACSVSCVGGMGQEMNLNSQNKEEYKIPAFFLRRKGAKVTILFSHGNAEDLGMMYRRMKEMAMLLCANVMAYDYTGYGLSTPSSCPPSEEMCYRNIEAAYSHLVNNMKIPPSQIILYGRSLGSGPSCYLAKKTADEGNSVAGLILHSPFLSIYRIVFDSKVNILGDMFINKAYAPDVRCPVLIIHGTKDCVVPFWHGDELLRSFPPECRAQPFWVPGVGHNNIEIKRKEDYILRIIRFIELYIDCSNSGSSSGNTNIGRSRPLKVSKNEQYKPETSLKESGKFIINQTWIKHGMSIIGEAIQEKKKKKNIIQSGNEPLSASNVQPPATKRSNEINEFRSQTYSGNSPKKERHELERQQRQHQQWQQQLNQLNIAKEQSNYEQQQQHDSLSPPRKLSPSLSPPNPNTDNTESLNFNRTTTNDLISKIKESEIENKSSSMMSFDDDQSQQSISSRFILTKESWATDEDISFEEGNDNLNNENSSAAFKSSVSMKAYAGLSEFTSQSTFIRDACESFHKQSYEE